MSGIAEFSTRVLTDNEHQLYLALIKTQEALDAKDDFVTHLMSKFVELEHANVKLKELLEVQKQEYLALQEKSDVSTQSAA